MEGKLCRDRPNFGICRIIGIRPLNVQYMDVSNTYLSICLCICLSVCLSVCLSISILHCHALSFNIQYTLSPGSSYTKTLETPGVTPERATSPSVPSHGCHGDGICERPIVAKVERRRGNQGQTWECLNTKKW